MKQQPTKQEVEELRARLVEAEDTIEAIRQGAVDALVIKESEQQQVYTLKTADHTYRVLIESMAQAAITIDEEGIILYSNSQFSRLVGRPLQRIIGSSLLTFFSAKDQPALARHVQEHGQALAVKKAYDSSRNEIELDLPEPLHATVILSVTRLPQTNGGVEANAYMGIVITDITDRKRAEKAKDEFISLASHQLRTPATGVKQYLGMLLEGYAGDLSEDQQMFVKTAYTSNETQLGIISSILKTAQIDSGVYAVSKTSQCLRDIVDAVLSDFQPLLLMRQQKLVCDIDGSLEVKVDKAEMAIALANLIENASKYSPNSKRVTIRARQTARSTIIRVSDQGVGIAAPDHDSVFEKFTRIDNDMSDTVSGSGLGLYWVKRIVGMHDGTITISSQLGKGTTFTIKLPR